MENSNDNLEKKRETQKRTPSLEAEETIDVRFIS